MTLIAIVDDSRLARRFAAASLKHAGHAVAELEPTTLDEVMAALRTLQPGILVLDQQMPTFSGSNLVRACFEDDALCSVKVVMLTAQRDEELERRMQKLGVHAVLHKPVSPDELCKAVAALAVAPGGAL